MWDYLLDEELDTRVVGPVVRMLQNRVKEQSAICYIYIDVRYIHNTRLNTHGLMALLNNIAPTNLKNLRRTAYRLTWFSFSRYTLAYENHTREVINKAI